jgi:hypothetical protein
MGVVGSLSGAGSAGRQNECGTISFYCHLAIDAPNRPAAESRGEYHVIGHPSGRDRSSEPLIIVIA